MSRASGAVLVLWAGVAAITVVTARSQPAFALARSPLGLAAEIAASGLLVLATLRTALPLALAATVWLLAEWPTPGAPGGLAFTIGLVLAGAAPAAVAHAAAGHVRRPDVIVLSLGAVGLLGLAPTLLSDPHAQGCGVCPANVLNVAERPELAADLERWGVWVTAVAAGVCAAVFAWRRQLLPAAFLGFSAAALADAWSRGFSSNDTTERTLRAATGATLVLLAGERVWKRVAARRARTRLAREVVDLASSMRPGGVRALLADAIGDPDLEVLHPHRGGWIDAGGTPGDPGPGAKPIAVDGTVTAMVRTDGEIDRVRDVGRVARIAIVHEGLQARLRAQLTALQASRAQVVAAGDAERRRLERDLHDGAQQGLASLAMGLGLSRDPDAGEARARVLEALEHLRELAHGIYPTALAEAGLAAALDVLAEWQPRLTVGAVPERRLDPRVEATAYGLVEACVREGHGAVAVSVRERDGALHVEVCVAGAPDLGEVEDRVGVIGGSLVVENDRVRAVLPCG